MKQSENKFFNIVLKALGVVIVLVFGFFMITCRKEKNAEEGEIFE